jgi:DNA ligase-associated metallophosphoesterase
MSAPDAAVEVAGERLHLLGERAVWWERAGTLVVADLHWGKAATFRASGIPIPAGTTEADLGRLSAAVTRTAARRLVILGDLFHARAGRVPRTLGTIAAWRAAHPNLEVLLVRGNHDRHAGDPPAEFGFDVVNGPHPLGPFVLRHEPAPSPDGYVLAGHLHPGVRLHGPGRQSVRLPCFAFGRSVALLPAFSEFTGTAEREPRDGDRVYIIAGDEVFRV